MELMKGECFWRWNAEGRVFEYVDMVTGAIVKVAKEPGSQDTSIEYVSQTFNGKEVLVQTGIADSYKPQITYSYSAAIAQVICQLLMEGRTEDEISNMPGMPDRLLIRAWRKRNPKFDEAVHEAIRYRADSFHDEVVKLGREATLLSKDEVPGQKLAVETMKWAAKVGDPGKYGDKLKVEADIAHEITVETGIRRRTPIPSPIIDITPAHPNAAELAPQSDIAPMSHTEESELTSPELLEPQDNSITEKPLRYSTEYLIKREDVQRDDLDIPINTFEEILDEG